MLKQTTYAMIVLVMTCLTSTRGISEERESQDQSQNLKNFLELPFTKEDETSVKETIKSLVNKDLNQLLEDLVFVERAKERLEKIPPLKLIAFLLSDPESNQLIKAMGATDIRLHFVMMWLALLLSDLRESDLFAEQLSGFSEFLDLDDKIVRNYVEQENFTSLVRYLLFPSAPICAYSNDISQTP